MDETLVYWMLAFSTCRSSAFIHCPHNIYRDLRTGGFVDQEHDLTDKAIEFLNEEGYQCRKKLSDVHGLECLATAMT